MKSNIKRFTLVTVAVGLVCVLLVGSALAFNVTYQKVAMPDPYGVVPLGLDDASTVRTVKISGYTTFGPYSPSSSRVVLNSPTVSVTSGSTISDWLISSFSATDTYTGGYFAVAAGAIYDVLSSVAFSASEYESLLVTGGGTFYVFPSYISGTAPGFSPVYPSTAQFLVNGLPVGSSVDCVNGQFTFPDLVVDMTEDVSSLGVRFTFASLSRQEITSGSFTSSLFLRTPFEDNLNIAPVPINSVDYVPYFERVISWLQSINGSISVTNNTLERIESVLGGMNDSDSALGRLASIFARDDDLQLRDDMDPVLKEATSIFYDSTENPSTAVSTDTVTTAGETLKGMGSMFNSGYDATDAFQDIADNQDDYLAWFSSETQSWLDTVPAAASDEDDPDPYNHWMVNNQYAEIAKKRGED